MIGIDRQQLFEKTDYFSQVKIDRMLTFNFDCQMNFLLFFKNYERRRVMKRKSLIETKSLH